MSGGLSRLADLLAASQREQDTYGVATYMYTDPEGVAWVRLEGSDTDTPANGGTTAEAQEGDTVTVRQDGTHLYIVGNGTAPAVGERQVSSMLQPVQDEVSGIVGSVRTAIADSAAAQKIAETVAAIAEATSQHFWTDDGGVHVTQVTREQWEYAEGETYHSGPNVLINTLGQLFRDGLNNLLTLTTEGGARALTIWDGLGNAAGNIRAIIGESIQLGGTGESHAVLDYHSMQLVDKEGDTYFHVSDLRGTDGTAEIVESFYGDGTTVRWYLSHEVLEGGSVTVDGTEAPEARFGHDSVYFMNYVPADGSVIEATYTSEATDIKQYTLGVRGTGIKGGMSVAEGLGCLASGLLSHAEGYNSSALGKYAHSEGHSTEASGIWSHAEGKNTAATTKGAHAEGENATASGVNAHAEGFYVSAIGDHSHVEGGSNEASGSGAHAEGFHVVASGGNSHAEGYYTTAGGSAAHAQNRGTIANGDAQTAIGNYNKADTSSALIIGNGTNSSSRSNALTVDWDGNALLATGKLRIEADSSYIYLIHTTDGTTEDVRFRIGGSGVPNINASTDGGTTYQAAFYSAINSSRTANRVLASPNGSTGAASFRALVAADLPTVTRAKGGTGVTAKASSTVTLSNSTASSNECWHNGVVATVVLGSLRLSSELASSSNRKVGNVPSAYRPSSTVYAVGGGSNDAISGKVFIAIASSGDITLYNRMGATIATTTGMFFTATYAI